MRSNYLRKSLLFPAKSKIRYWITMTSVTILIRETNVSKSDSTEHEFSSTSARVIVCVKSNMNYTYGSPPLPLEHTQSLSIFEQRLELFWIKTALPTVTQLSHFYGLLREISERFRYMFRHTLLQKMKTNLRLWDYPHLVLWGWNVSIKCADSSIVTYIAWITLYTISKQRPTV